MGFGGFHLRDFPGKPRLNRGKKAHKPCVFARRFTTFLEKILKTRTAEG
jgi:hypothetical protein